MFTNAQRRNDLTTPAPPTASGAPDRLLRIGEVQTLTSLSARKIFSLASTGQLPRVKLGRATRFRLSDVQQLIRRGAV